MSNSSPLGTQTSALKTHAKNAVQICIASKNGSGSLTANRLLHKALFREGFHVVGKNLFPSNIEGLPTHYILRLSQEYNSIAPVSDIYVGLNPVTYEQDFEKLLSADAISFTNTDLKLKPRKHSHGFSFRQLSKDIELPIKTKKRVSNLFYVGWLAGILGLKESTFKTLIFESFSKTEICETNFLAFKKGFDFFNTTDNNRDSGSRGSNASGSKNGKDNASGSSNGNGDLQEIAQKLQNFKSKDLSQEQILIEGNQAAALAWVDAGCTVATWYPITPSTSLVESFEDYANQLRPKTSDQKNTYAVLQAEDELSAICAVVGAAWSGARAATATSGPGLSLMNEAVGLAYFTEVPAVIWDIQRLGPSTGLPTRTSQGDILSAYYCSHGDTFHPVLLPSNPKEAFEMAYLAFDLAETYQTPVFVLSDLDIGMNIWSSPQLEQSQKKLQRGQVLSELELEEVQDFKRYLADDKGVAARTLPGTHHAKAAYMTRGSGHDVDSSYSEDPKVYEQKITRLQNKVLNARDMLTRPKIQDSKQSHGLIYYGSSEQIFPEVLELLNESGFDLCCLKSLPLHDEVFDFIKSHEKVFVIEQNRDLQVLQIIRSYLNKNQTDLIGISTINGWPIQAHEVAKKLNEHLQFDQPTTVQVNP